MTAQKHSRASRLVDEQLARYRSMRDFGVTTEPKGAPKPKRNARKAVHQGLPFVIQKHDATRLHYDFRIGWNGVLKSWAVTKGPSYYPGDKRLAVQVEDHPMEYGGFEGIIPKGQYGGGTVMVWDQGTWEPHGDVDEGLATGRLKFALHGQKLQGNWTLIRMGGRAANAKKPNWLLIKEHDEYARSADAPAITEEAPDSAVTGRDLGAIAAGQDHVWGSAGVRGKTAPPAKKSNAATRDGGSKKHGQRVRASLQTALGRYPREAAPKFIPPQLASSTSSPPRGSGWIHELKLDGYRIQAHIVRAARNQRKCVLLTRKGLDWTAKMPDIADQLTLLPVESAVLDGEVVVLTSTGGTSFALLQAAFQEGKRQPLYYFVFDLLHLDGRNLRNEPLVERKRMLKEILEPLEKDSFIRFSEHLDVDGQEMFSKACDLRAEGIVSKEASAKYTSGRSRTWLKLKCETRQEFVIGGFTLPSNGSYGVGALLLGYYRDGKLIYAGRTGTGFTQAIHRMLRDRLEKLRRKQPPFDSLVPEAKRGAFWVKPVLVAEVSFATWTADNLVRQAAFQGLREDKPAREVVREEAGTASSRSKRSNRPPPGKRVRSGTKAARRKESKPPQAAQYSTRITHPEKQLDVESKLTKRDLADYYWAIAAHMLPHIASRPLSIVRCPEGSDRPCFFQKHTTGTLPPGIESVAIPENNGAMARYITLSTPEALVGLAQMGVLEIHPWGSHNDSIETPDRIIFDLDPGESISWSMLVDSAREIRSRLKQYHLESFVKTTGGKGLHVVAPIEPNHTWPQVKEFAHAVAQRMEKENPKLYLTKMTRSSRKGHIYLDYLRNVRGATAVAPYSPRARSGAPVSMPLDWKELAGKNAPVFLAADFSEWSKRLRHDPWKKMLAIRQSLILP